MKATGIPFNLEILKMDANAVKNLRPVLTTDIMESSGQKLGPTELLNLKTLTWQGDEKISSDFHPDGLFSVAIFGRVGEELRDHQFSYIDLRTTVFHPLLYKTICKLKGLYGEILAGKGYAVWSEEEMDFIASNPIDGRTGFQFFVKYWETIQFKRTDSSQRDDRIKLLEKYKDRALVNRILILPAGLRDARMGAGNRLEIDDINDYYRRIVGISRTITSGGAGVSSAALDYSRYQLQCSFNELYQHIENVLSGKKGFVQQKWASRRVFNSTRNVISSMDTSKPVLGAPGAPRVTDTILGLYQVVKGALPLTIHLLRAGYLGEAFSIGDTNTVTKLVNTKTLESEFVELPSVTKDRWTTLDGLQKIINSYWAIENRHKAVMVEGRYLGLIYKGPNSTFRIFGDIRELPETLDRQYVEPLTLIELLYLSGYREWNKLKVIVTRYPITGIGSTYPSDLYVKTSLVGEQRSELGPDWQPLGEDFVASEFPTRVPLSFVDSQIVSPVRIDSARGLNADRHCWC
jgi:hypothetical protein